MALLLGVRMWALWDPMLFVLLCHIYLWERWVTFSLGLRVIVLPIITFIIDVTSLHVWSESITTFLHISIVSLSFLSLLVIHLIPFTSYSPLTVTHLGFDTSHHHYTYHYQFILLHLSPYRYHIHVRHSQVHGSWGSLYMLHFIYEGMSSDHRVFGPSFLSFLLPYHLSLRYVPCLKTTLRPWDQMSSSAASTWTGDWDLVDV